MVDDSTNAMTVTLPSDREILLTRSFNAPRGLVFEAFTKPEHLKRWWGPRSTTLVVCEVDLSPGGIYRYVLLNPDGSTVGFFGAYSEVVPPERLVYTQFFVPDPENTPIDPDSDDGVIETVTFIEQNGRTTVTSTTLCPSAEVRDMILQTGMETGAAESYDRLAELLEAMG